MDTKRIKSGIVPKGNKVAKNVGWCCVEGGERHKGEKEGPKQSKFKILCFHIFPTSQTTHSQSKTAASKNAPIQLGVAPSRPHVDASQHVVPASQTGQNKANKNTSTKGKKNSAVEVGVAKKKSVRGCRVKKMATKTI
ncbi:hypothetical protein Tco_0453831 [Tanacetum coccineum]